MAAPRRSSGGNRSRCSWALVAGATSGGYLRRRRNVVSQLPPRLPLPDHAARRSLTWAGTSTSWLPVAIVRTWRPITRSPPPLAMLIDLTSPALHTGSGLRRRPTLAAAFRSYGTDGKARHAGGLADGAFENVMINGVCANSAGCEKSGQPGPALETRRLARRKDVAGRSSKSRYRKGTNGGQNAQHAQLPSTPG